MRTLNEDKEWVVQNLPQPRNNPPSALARAGMFLLVPIALTLLVPILLLFIIVLYALAIFHGTRVFVFSITGKQEMSEHELQEPHFIEVQVHEKALSDESPPSSKG